jgi:flavin-dependent dehydrogenase
MADFKVTELQADIDFESLAYWDAIIIGASPSGLAASLTTAHRGLTTLVIEAKGRPGGQPQFLYPDKKIVDIPGFPDGISGEELSSRGSIARRATLWSSSGSARNWSTSRTLTKPKRKILSRR